MISIFTAFVSGLKDVYKTKKLVLLFFMVQFVLAYILTKPFSNLLSKTFSTNTLSDVILNKFNLIYFYSMFKEFGQGVSLFGLLIPAIILYALITVFLTAGVFWLFYSKSEFILSEFFTSCGNYFSRFFRLYSISFLFYAGCIIVFLLLYGVKSSVTEDSISEVWPVILTIANIGLLIILFAMVMIIFDYAKILVITENNTGLFSSVFEALKFFMMNFFKTIGIYLLYIITAILLFIVFIFVDSFIIANTYFTIFIFFVISQVFVFLRQYLRLALYDSIIVFYQKSLTAIPGMLNKKMLEMAVINYEKRAQESEDNS